MDDLDALDNLDSVESSKVDWPVGSSHVSKFIIDLAVHECSLLAD